MLAAIAAVRFEDLSAAMTEIAGKYPRDPAKQLIEARVAYVLSAGMQSRAGAAHVWR